MKKELIGSIDRITEQTACIILNDDEHQLQIPLELLPDGADEGMAFTITIERNEEEEKRLAEEIATLKESLSQIGEVFSFAFYGLRATAFPRTQMRLRRDRLKLTTTLREALSA